MAKPRLSGYQIRQKMARDKRAQRLRLPRLVVQISLPRVFLIFLVTGGTIFLLFYFFRPLDRLAGGRNVQRIIAISAIMGAVSENIADSGGQFDFTDCSAKSLTAAPQIIASQEGLDLCDCLVPRYISALPYDPKDGYFKSCQDYNTGLTIAQEGSDRRVSIAAPGAELGARIYASR